MTGTDWRFWDMPDRSLFWVVLHHLKRVRHKVLHKCMQFFCIDSHAYASFRKLNLQPVRMRRQVRGGFALLRDFQESS